MILESCVKNGIKKYEKSTKSIKKYERLKVATKTLRKVDGEWVKRVTMKRGKKTKNDDNER